MTKRLSLILILLLGVVRCSNVFVPNAIAAPLKVVTQKPELIVPFDVINVNVGTEGNNVAKFSCRDIQWKNQSGEPQVPWQVITVLLPPDAILETVAVNLKHPRFETIAGLWDVSSSPPVAIANKETQQFWPKDKKIINGRDVDIYGKDAFWPQFDAQFVSTGEMRKWKLAQVAIPLIKYNPAQKKLKKLIRGELEIYFDRTSLPLTSPSTIAKMRDRIGEDTVRRIAVNFEQQNAAYTESIGKSEKISTEENKLQLQEGGEALPGYVIITTSEIQAASQKLNDFVAHKQSRGFDVQVITDANFGGGVGDTAAENIRTWLQAHYISDNIQYVLLIGNPHPLSGDIPMKMLYPRNNEGDEYKESPSDYYYADLTGNWDLDGDGYYGEWNDDFGSGGIDRNWDVLIGRIPVYPHFEEPNGIGQVLYDSGEPQRGVYYGDNKFLGFLSGNGGSGMEQRWAAHPFTLPEGTWNITQIRVDYATYSDAPFDLVRYIIWRRTGQESPEADDEIIQGVVPAPLSFDDPRIPEADDYLHYIDVNFPLEGGDYYLTVYGDRSDGQPNGYFGWLGNTENGIPLLNPDPNPNPGVNAFFWRSAQFPSPGFATYNLPKSTWDSLPGQDPNQLYTAAFTIYGTAEDSNGGSFSQSQQTQTASVDINDLDHILTKIIAYENAPQSECTWRQSILLPMKTDGYASDYIHLLGEGIKETVAVPKTGWSYHRIYDQNYSFDPPPESIPCSKDNVVSAWTNSPFGVVVWATHGLETSASYVMDNAAVAALNDNYPAFTFQASCLNAHPETAVNLAYSLLKNGAVNTIGSTRVAWILVLDTMFKGMASANGFAAEYASQLIGEETNAADALYKSKQILVPTDAMFWMNFTNFNVYGCPDTGLYSYEPSSMTVLPNGTLTISGDSGGPFEPNSQVYTITNHSSQTINYKVEKSQGWLSLNDDSSTVTGILEPNESNNITVSINSSAESLPAGSYYDSIKFTNLTTGIGTTNRQVFFKPQIVYGGTNIGPDVAAIAVDRLGNVFAAGYANYAGDGHLIKILSDGTESWHYVYGGYVYPKGVATDNSGNIFVTGNFSGTVDFDPTEGEDWFSSANGSGFLTRINHDGSYEWTLQMADGGYDVAIDSFDNILFTGSVVAKLSPDGTYIWTLAIGATARDITVDSSGNIVLTGYFQGTVDFDPTDGVDTHISNGGYDAFVTKLTPQGNYCWTRTIGNTGREYSNNVAVDYLGNIFIAGYFDDYQQPQPYVVDFDPTEGVDLRLNHVGADAFLLKLGFDGSYIWTRTISSPTHTPDPLFGGQAESYEAVVLDGGGNPLITGYVGDQLEVDFDPTYGADWHTGKCVFITRLLTDGSYGWTAVIDGAREGTGIAVDNNGSVWVGGYFYGNVDFDPTDGEDWRSAGTGSLGFVTKLEHSAVPVMVPLVVINTHPASGNVECVVRQVDVTFSEPAINVSSDDLTLSSGNVIAVTGTDAGPYVFNVVDTLPGLITAQLDGDITDYNGVDLPSYRWTFTQTSVPPDLDCDLRVDFADLAIFTYHWLEQDCIGPDWCDGADLDEQGTVDFVDYVYLANHWFEDYNLGELNITITADDSFVLYISTDDNVLGTLIGTGNDWQQNYQFTATITPGVSNFIHVVGVDTGYVAGFAGVFEIASGNFGFENGTNQLDTAELNYWSVSRTGFGQNYEVPTLSSYTWPNAFLNGRAIWTNNGYDLNTTRYFSTKITPGL